MQAEQRNIFVLLEKKSPKRIFGARLDILQRAGEEAGSAGGSKRKASAQTSSGDDFIAASDPARETSGAASPSRQHHLPSEPSPSSRHRPWGWFRKAGAPKEPSKTRLSSAACSAGGRRRLRCHSRPWKSLDFAGNPSPRKTPRQRIWASGLAQEQPRSPPEHAAPTLSD